MMSNYWRIGFCAIGLTLALLILAVSGCSSAAPTATPTEAPPTAEVVALTGDPVRGGLLYDKWWEVTETDAPTGDHPLWATQTTNTRSGLDTWRCKECHGWDYQGAEGVYGSGSHFTGFVGVYTSRTKSPAEILAAMKGSTNPDHDFSTVMAEQDLVDLTLFIAQAVIDDSQLINADKSSVGDAAQGQPLFEEVCAKCHGPAGNAINFGGLDEPEFLGHLAPDNPWEFIHKVRFGQPGWPMPSAIANDWTDEDLANVLAYAQTFSTEPALSGGGPLYDKWWEALGLAEPTGDQPLWSTQTTNTRSGLDTWRCKECHGWDYEGA
ncbi:MAG: cytochrome c, partial [Chloroflexota bacterium]